MGQTEQYTIEKPYLYHLALWILTASSFALGIGFAYAHHMIAIFAAVALLPGVFALTGSKKLTGLLPVLFLFGYVSLMRQRTLHAYTVAHIEHKTVTVEACIESIEPVKHPLYRYIIIAQVEKTVDCKDTSAIESSWRLQCYMHFLPRFEVGDTVSFEQLVIRAVDKSSFYDYLVKEHIHATIFLKTHTYQILKHPSFSIRRSLHTYKHALLKRIRSKCSHDAFTLFASIFMGNRNCVKQEYQTIKELFHHWGILHFLARSGLHLVLFILLLQLLLYRIPIPLLAKHLLIMSVTATYALLSWESISFARACATFSWYKFCHIAGLQINVTHIVLLLSCIFLVYNPSLLFFLDFQLSFALTLILSITNQLSGTQK